MDPHLGRSQKGVGIINSLTLAFRQPAKRLLNVSVSPDTGRKTSAPAFYAVVRKMVFAQGDRDFERGAFPESACNFNFASVEFHKLFDKGKAYAGAS